METLQANREATAERGEILMRLDEMVRLRVRILALENMYRNLNPVINPVEYFATCEELRTAYLRVNKLAGAGYPRLIRPSAFGLNRQKYHYLKYFSR